MPKQAGIRVFFIFVLLGGGLAPFLTAHATLNQLREIGHRTDTFGEFIINVAAMVKTQKYVVGDETGALWRIRMSTGSPRGNVKAVAFMRFGAEQKNKLLVVVEPNNQRLFEPNSEGDNVFRADLYFASPLNLGRTNLVDTITQFALILMSDDDILSFTFESQGKDNWVLFVPRAQILAYAKNVFMTDGTVVFLNALIAGLLLAVYLTRVVHKTISSVSDKVLLRVDQQPQSKTTPSKQSIQDIRDELDRELLYQSRMASLGVNASYMAHDVRNILASLQLTAERLSTLTTEKERAVAKSLTKTIDKCMILLEWAVTFANEKYRSVEIEKVRLLPIVEEVRELTLGDDGRESIEFIIECDPDLLALTDRDMLFRVLFNLANNSAMALTKKSGFSQIRILAYQDRGGVLIYVSDTGAGFGTEGINKSMNIGEAYSSKSKGGLGLKIARDFIQSLDGSIELVRSDESGTHFLITLPAYAEPFEALEVS